MCTRSGAFGKGVSMAEANGCTSFGQLGSYSHRNAPQFRQKLRRPLLVWSLPLPSVTTLMSLTQAPLMFWMLLAALVRPLLIASSMPFADEALISMTFAMLMTISVVFQLVFSPGLARGAPWRLEPVNLLPW